eukprot:c14413_g1_i1.p1 GENE.c14413_g1_i1~~c14413_g1_i1.p1  ORF type:complete len:209 (+),score=20.75 c14413_g1_i1:319-945(+)
MRSPVAGSTIRTVASRLVYAVKFATSVGIDEVEKAAAVATAAAVSKVREIETLQRDVYEAKTRECLNRQISDIACRRLSPVSEDISLSKLPPMDQFVVAAAFTVERSGFIRKDARVGSMTSETVADRKRKRGDDDLPEGTVCPALLSSAILCPVHPDCKAAPVVSGENCAQSNLKDHIDNMHTRNGDAERFFGPHSALHSWWEVKQTK